MNLNKILEQHTIKENVNKFKNQSTINNDKCIEVCFENIEDKIIEKIKQSDLIFGCIGWLTNKKILKEMSEKHCIIVVQDEDFLRLDNDFDEDKQKWKNEIYNMYKKLEGHNLYSVIPEISHQCSVNTGIRRFGFINKEKLPAFPTMHNKFIICAKYTDNKFIARCGEHIAFSEVITGSYNYTYSSTNSLENILCINDNKIINAYYENFKNILGCSVQLE